MIAWPPSKRRVVVVAACAAAALICAGLLIAFGPFGSNLVSELIGLALGVVLTVGALDALERREREAEDQRRRQAEEEAEIARWAEVRSHLRKDTVHILVLLLHRVFAALPAAERTDDNNPSFEAGATAAWRNARAQRLLEAFERSYATGGLATDLDSAGPHALREEMAPYIEQLHALVPLLYEARENADLAVALMDLVSKFHRWTDFLEAYKSVRGHSLRSVTWGYCLVTVGAIVGALETVGEING